MINAGRIYIERGSIPGTFRYVAFWMAEDGMNTDFDCYTSRQQALRVAWFVGNKGGLIVYDVTGKHPRRIDQLPCPPKAEAA